MVLSRRGIFELRGGVEHADAFRVQLNSIFSVHQVLAGNIHIPVKGKHIGLVDYLLAHGFMVDKNLQSILRHEFIADFQIVGERKNDEGRFA